MEGVRLGLSVGLFKTAINISHSVYSALTQCGV